MFIASGTDTHKYVCEVLWLISLHSNRFIPHILHPPCFFPPRKRLLLISWAEGRSFAPSGRGPCSIPWHGGTSCLPFPDSGHCFGFAFLIFCHFKWCCREHSPAHSLKRYAFVSGGETPRRGICWALRWILHFQGCSTIAFLRGCNTSLLQQWWSRGYFLPSLVGVRDLIFQGSFWLQSGKWVREKDALIWLIIQLISTRLWTPWGLKQSYLVQPWIF